MDTNEHITVHSLSEYFSVLERCRLYDFISRGESRAFPGIVSSALRLYRGTGKVYTPKYIHAFYDTIGNTLTPLQRKHFLAFAQHHSLPTNLIDFSFSPLVSLFFACYGGQDAEKENGYVYFIDQSKLITAERFDFLDEYAVWEDYVLQLQRQLEQKIDIYLDEDKEDVIWLIKQCLIGIQHLCRFILDPFHNKDLLVKYSGFLSENISRTENPYPLIDHAVRLMVDYYDNMECYIDENGQFKTHYSKDSLSELCFLEEFRAYVRDDIFHGKETSAELGELLCFFSRICLGLGELSGRDPNFTLPFYYSYKPPNISERINIQSSIFIYQMSFVEREFDAYKTKYQSIVPDIVVEVENKKSILDQLDHVGINLKTIYGDYDHVAAYLKQLDLQ